MITIFDILTQVPELRKKTTLNYKCPTLSKRLKLTVPNYIKLYLLSIGVDKSNVDREIFDHWHKAMLYTNGELDVQGFMLCFECLVFSTYDSQFRLKKSMTSKNPWLTTPVKSIGCQKDIDVRNILLHSLSDRFTPKQVVRFLDENTKICKSALIDEGIRSGSNNVYCPGRKILSRTVESRLLASLLSKKTITTKINIQT